MSALIELITAWEEFAATHRQEVSVRAFCDEYLHKAQAQPKQRAKETGFDLARRIGRVAAIQRTCIRLALRDVPGIEPEWYYLLHAIHEAGEVRKTDVISINLFLEPTTGIDILNRMIKAGLLKETQDVEDKRARLVALTGKGEATLRKAEQQVRMVVDMIFAPDMADGWAAVDGMLGPLDHRWTDLLAGGRPKTLEELLTLAR